MATITLTTDFGVQDWFVGTMKGVIAGIAPKARVIDLTHSISPGDIWGAAFSLLSSYAFFPRETIHVVIVDPWVGGARRPLAVKTSRFLFIGPDNGVLSWALRSERVLGARVLENTAYFLKVVSNTFHGRDIFSPVAAHLASGVPFEDLGSPASGYHQLEWPEPIRRGTAIEGRVLYIDRFGNGITNIPIPEKPLGKSARCRIEANQRWTIACAQYYSAVPLSSPVLVPGSTGYLEVAINGGSAERVLGLQRGSAVVIET